MTRETELSFEYQVRSKQEREALGFRTDEQPSSPSISGSLRSQGEAAEKEGGAVEKEGDVVKGKSGPAASVPPNSTSEPQSKRCEASPVGEDSKDMPDCLPFQVRLPAFNRDLAM